MTVHMEYLITERTGFAIGSIPEQYFSGWQLERTMQQRNQYSRCMDQLLLEGIESGVFTPVDIKIVRNIILGAMNWVIEWYSPEDDQGRIGTNHNQLFITIDNEKLKIRVEREN